ncbi:MAG: type II toxin-antitoxin system RelE/ParE family toxin [Candidatus Binatia bacterium]
MKEPWILNEYVTEQGGSPLRDFLSGLEASDRVEAFALIQLARERGNTLRLPHSKALGNGLHELRGQQVRIFYMFQPGRRIILIDGMLKKRGDIPSADLKRLRKIQERINERKKEN